MKSKRFFITSLLGLSIAAAAIAGTAGASGKGTLSGAGSTFVYPLVSTWASDYHASKINYSPIGSGGGIQAISNRQVDFGASDAPLTKDQSAGCHGCVQIPWALAGTSIPYHLGGISPHLKITGTVLAKIYLGQIKKWNAPAIKKLNKGVSLPSEKITPIYRSDASGTTYNFTDYLSKVSKAFKSRIGRGTQVNFPTGIGASHSSGVSAALNQTNGGIAYVDTAYSVKDRSEARAEGGRAEGVHQVGGPQGPKGARGAGGPEVHAHRPQGASGRAGDAQESPLGILPTTHSRRRRRPDGAFFTLGD